MEHHCGVLGIVGFLMVDTFPGNLNLLQHRGYEGAGISYLDNKNKIIKTHKDLGLVKDVFKDFKYDQPIEGIGIGHVRYSTRKKLSVEQMRNECQPFSTKNNTFAIAHNGNIPTINKLKEEHNIISNTNSDTLLLMKIIKKVYKRYNNWSDTLKYIMNKVSGSYCLLILTKDKLYALRDRYGIRPLCLGENSRGGKCVSSETIGLKHYNYIRDVNPGEIVSIDTNKKLVSEYQYTKPNRQFCSFEYIYFMNHESIIQDKTVEDYRYKLGYELGKQEQKIQDTIVLCIPNSAIPSSNGFADVLNLSWYDWIIKKSTAKRTFILSNQKERSMACDNKFYYDSENLKNKNVYLIDDSVVRGTTTKSVIKKLKSFGVKDIHVRVPAPKIISPCYFGIDMSTKEELIAVNKTDEQIAKILGATSIKYLDTESMKNAFDDKVCTSCFTGKYDKDLLDW